MVDNKIVVGISQGDLNGIGLEIILKTLSDPALSNYAEYLYYLVLKKQFLILERC